MLAALWGGNPVAVKIGLGGLPPLRLACLRFVLGGLVILVYAWWTRHREISTRHSPGRTSYAVPTVVLAHFLISGDRMTPREDGRHPRRLHRHRAALRWRLLLPRARRCWKISSSRAARSCSASAPSTWRGRCSDWIRIKLLVFQSAIGSACFLVASLALEGETSTCYTASLAACSLTTPLFGVLIAAAVVGDHLRPVVLLSSLMVAAGIGLAARR